MATGNGKPQKQWGHKDWLVYFLQEAGNASYDTALAQASALISHPEFFIRAAEEAQVLTLGTEEHETDS